MVLKHLWVWAEIMWMLGLLMDLILSWRVVSDLMLWGPFLIPLKKIHVGIIICQKLNLKIPYNPKVWQTAMKREMVDSRKRYYLTLKLQDFYKMKLRVRQLHHINKKSTRKCSIVTWPKDHSIISKKMV